MSKWSNVPLPRIAFFQEGPGVRNYQYTNSGVKLLNVANLRDGKLDLSTSDRFISEEEAYGRYSHFLVDEGDLIIASSGIKVEYFEKKMGFVNKANLPLCMNTSTIRLKTINKSVLEIRYLLYFLKSILFKKQIQRLITGSAQLNFGPSHLEQIVVPLPPLEEQKCIAAMLDKAQSLIDLRKKQIAEMDALVKAKFIEMFGDPVTNPMGWKQTTIGESCYSVKDGPHVSPPYVEDGTGVPFISTRNLVSRNGIDWTTAKYISEADYEMCAKKCKPAKGDILYTKGGTTGIARYVDTDRRFANWVHVAVLKFGRDLNGVFFEHILNSDYCYQQSQLLTKGIANRDLVLGSMKQIQFFKPPLDFQNHFADFVQQADILKSAKQKSLDQMETLYNALMQRAFS